jgi:hypothetical protein
MPNIKNEDIKFLIQLQNKLRYPEVFKDDFKNDSKTLALILKDVMDKRDKSRERTAEIVAEKRKTNPLYGRSKAEKGRILAKLNNKNK